MSLGVLSSCSALTRPVAPTGPPTMVWSLNSTPSNADIQSIAYGNGIYVAVGSGNNIWTSSNGTSWTNRSPSNVSNYWLFVAFGNGIFIAGSLTGGYDANRFITSSDGVTWTVISDSSASTTIKSTLWRGIAYSDTLGLFVGVGATTSNRLMTSTDGINWSLLSVSGVANSSWLSVCWGGGKFVAVADGGSNRVLYSSDGTNWTLTTGITTEYWVSVRYVKDRYIAVAYNGSSTRIMKSTDGANWSAVTSPVSGFNPKSVCYIPGKFIMVGPSYVLVSDDGDTWSIVSSQSTPTKTNSWSCISTNGSQVVAIKLTGGDGAVSLYGTPA